MSAPFTLDAIYKTASSEGYVFTNIMETSSHKDDFTHWVGLNVDANGPVDAPSTFPNCTTAFFTNEAFSISPCHLFQFHLQHPEAQHAMQSIAPLPETLSQYPFPVPTTPVSPPHPFNGARLLVSGATGFIGRTLLSHLRLLHPDVIPLALIHPSSDPVPLQRLLDYPSSTPSVFKATLHDLPSLVRIFRDVDIVIHLAAQMDFFPDRPSTLHHVNVSGTRTLLEAAAREGDRRGKRVRFVYVSSAEAVGITTRRVSEDVDRNPDSEYGLSKMWAEDLVNEYLEKVDAVIARPTGVYGPGERFYYWEMMNVVANGLAFVLPAEMTGKCVFVHVEDVVSALMTCALEEKAVGGTFFVCADEEVEYRKVVECMAETLGVWKPLGGIPVRFGVPIVRALEGLLNRGKQRKFMFMAKTVSDSMSDRVYSNRRLKELGWKSKYGVLEGTKEAVKWEMSQGSVQGRKIPKVMQGALEMVGMTVFAVFRILKRRNIE